MNNRINKTPTQGFLLQTGFSILSSKLTRWPLQPAWTNNCKFIKITSNRSVWPVIRYNYNSTTCSISIFLGQQIALSPSQSLKHTPTIHCMARSEGVCHVHEEKIATAVVRTVQPTVFLVSLADLLFFSSRCTLPSSSSLALFSCVWDLSYLVLFMLWERITNLLNPSCHPSQSWDVRLRLNPNLSH